MSSSSPARTPKLQLAAEQPLTAEYLIPQKKMPHIQKQRSSPSKTVEGAKSYLESNPIPAPATDDQRVQTKRFAHQETP